MKDLDKKKEFNGNILIYYCYDVGDDIDFESVKEKQLLIRKPFTPSKYFKNYHTPLAIEIPHPHTSSRCFSSKLHQFGVISLAYKIPFKSNLEELRKEIIALDDEYREQSVIDAGSIFKKIKSEIRQPRFFHLRTSYFIIQVNQDPFVDIASLQENYGAAIASILRFETEMLSEYQKNEILKNAIGYYRGDLIIIDTGATFIYADEYEDLLDIFEFANVQQLELQYFDKLLDFQLDAIYERRAKKLTMKSYLPFIGTLTSDPVEDLGRLKVDISVITERLESNIKLADEVYFSEVYDLLGQKLELNNWRESINRKLDIIRDIRTIYQNKLDSLREDFLSVLIIVLIFIELVVGILSYFK